MSTPTQRSQLAQFLDLPDLDARDPDESFLHLPFRDTIDGVQTVLDRLAPHAEQLVASLDGDVRVRDLHNDFFRVVRAQRLSGSYSVAFTGTRRSDPTAVTGLHVVAGVLDVTSVSRNSRGVDSRSGTVRRRLGPGDSCLLKDDESHVVATDTGADVLQVVSPRWHRGRSFLLPTNADRLTVPERFRSMARHRARLAVVARSVAGADLAGAVGAVVSRAVQPLWAKLPGATATDGRRVMFVHAHPDDESSKGAATMAELVAQGHQVMVVTCTGGEQGSVLNPRAEHLSPEDIAGVRSAEMADALTYLGVRHHWLGYRDSGMPRDGVVAADSFVARAGQAASDLAGVIGEFRPDVLVTYDPSGGYPHPDHIAAHQVSIAAVASAAGERLGAHTPWEVPKVYYHVPFDGEIAQAAHRTLLGEGRESPFGRLLEQWKHHPERDPAARVTTRVWARRRSVYRAQRALLAHHTQVYPGSLGLLLPSVLRVSRSFSAWCRRRWPVSVSGACWRVCRARVVAADPGRCGAVPPHRRSPANSAVLLAWAAMAHPPTYSDDDPYLSQLRAVCLAFPESAEVQAWGRPTFRAGKKMFAVFDHADDHPYAVVFKPEPQEREALLGDPRCYVPKYFGPYGWLALDFTSAEVDWAEVTELMDASYRQVALKRMLTALDQA